MRPDEPNALCLNRTFSGAYRITSGVLDPWFSVAPPGSGDLFVAFRDSLKDVKISAFELNISDEALTVVLDHDATFVASWDGALTRRWIESPFPALGAYAATARFTHDNTLELHIHWLNGWFETLIRFRFSSNEVAITTKKLRLNPEDNYLICEATAVSGS